MGLAARKRDTPKAPVPQVVAWEITRACPLACIHCRAEAQPDPDPRQLTTQEGKALLEDIAGLSSRAVVILTGGEPLTRPDVFDLAAHGSALGLRMAISPDDGRLLTPRTVQRLKKAGIRRVSFSLHYPEAEQHDRFARTPGAFVAALEGLGHLRKGGLPFQINTTITRHNAGLLPDMYRLVLEVGAVSWDLFFLVPTGRARMLQSDELSSESYERLLLWLLETQRRAPIPVKQTCAPHFRRVERQYGRPGEPLGAGAAARRGAPAPAGDDAAPSAYSKRHGPSSRGCMAGDGFCFISHIGEVCGCGYLPVVAGNVRQRPFREIYLTSPLFALLRDPSRLEGKCGRCEFRLICGGCRARAYAATGNFLAEEPYCLYEPGRKTLPTLTPDALLSPVVT